MQAANLVFTIAIVAVILGGLVLLIRWLVGSEGVNSTEMHRLDEPLDEKTIRLSPSDVQDLVNQSDLEDEVEEQSEQPIFCTHCGAKSRGNSVFCERCGNRFDIASLKQQLSWFQPRVVLDVGRNPASDIRLFDGTASDKHAQVVFNHGSLMVEDMGSSNGTRIEAVPIQHPTLLAPGDRISFGRDVRTYDYIVSALIEKARGEQK